MLSENFNYREVGNFDVLNPVVTQIGTLDAADLDRQLRGMLANNSSHIAIDFTGIDTLYSDAITVIGRIIGEVQAKKGFFGVLGADPKILNTLKNVGLLEQIMVFEDETQLIISSMQLMQEAEKRTIKFEVADVALGTKEKPPEDIPMPEIIPVPVVKTNEWKYWVGAIVAILLLIAYFSRP
jgi:anti-anti-sigma regulatory factor